MSTQEIDISSEACERRVIRGLLNASPPYPPTPLYRVRFIDGYETGYQAISHAMCNSTAEWACYRDCRRVVFGLSDVFTIEGETLVLLV